MKKYAYFQFLVTLMILVSAAITFSGCDKNDGPSASEKQMKLLEGTWSVSSVTVDGVDHSSLFNGFALTFTDAPPAYTPSNGGKVWAQAKQFNFLNGNATEFNGPAEQIVTITTLTENSLVFEMDWSETTFGSGRKNSIAGHHVFVFSK